MLTRIRPRPLVDLFRRDLPGPLDVINLITTARFDRYRWYGLLVFPIMSGVGGRVRWMGRFEQSVHGEQQAQKLLIVRYPSHRHFLAMTLNPYYLTINRLREAGVSRFEASFTKASVTADDLAKRRTLVAVHFNGDALDVVRSVVEPVAGELVYATEAVASLGFLDPPVDTDPHPMTFGRLAMFAPPDGEAPALGGLAAELDRVTDGCSLQVYRREPAAVYRPSFRGSSTASAATA